MATPFTVVTPIAVSDSNFVSSTLTESDYTAYSAATTYALGNRVIVVADHKIYESLANTNIAHTPSTSPTWWVEVSATNRWKVYDKSGGSLSAGTTSMEWVVNAPNVDSVAVLDISASSVRIVGTRTGTSTVVYDQTITLPDTALITSWYDYFFTEIRKSTQVFALDIPVYADMQIKVIVSGTGAISAGTIIYGNQYQFGYTQYGATTGIIDYSIKSVSAYGIATIVQRTYSKRIDVSLMITSATVDAVQRKLASLRATEAVWIGAKTDYESLTVFGFMRDFSIDITYPDYSLATLQLEGLS